MDKIIADKLPITQYMALYCFVYEKVNHLSGYMNENRNELEHISALINKGFLNRPTNFENKEKTTLEDITATPKGVEYIKEMVDSYQDMKADTLLGDDEGMFDLAENIYAEEWKDFYDVYPISTVRKNGVKTSLRENKKQCRELYIELLQSGKINSKLLINIVNHYVQSKIKSGSQAYLKTMKNFLRDETWRDVWEEMQRAHNPKRGDNEKEIDYGGKLI